MARSKSLIVVGAGLFGSMAATFARRHGVDVTVVADQREGMASKASGCVLAPSWLSALAKEDVAEGMDVLSSMYKVHDVELVNSLGVAFKAKRVDLKDVLVKPDNVARVTAVGNGVVQLGIKGTLKADVVLVATGVWAHELMGDEVPSIRPLWGASLLFKDATMPTDKLNVYAPYRQAVAVRVNNGKDVWFGDGTALVDKTWLSEEDARCHATIRRGKELTKLKTTPVVTVGARPYIEGYKSGYLAKVSSKTWVATGGAKNGTLLAALFAQRFYLGALK